MQEKPSSLNLDTKKERITLVCVTDQFSCERIIKSGKTVADLTSTKLQIVSIISSEYPTNPEALEYLFTVSKLHGGQMNVEYTDSPYKALIEHIKKHKVSNVLTGLPAGKESIIYKLWSKFTHIKFFTVDATGTLSVARGLNSAQRSQYANWEVC